MTKLGEFSRNIRYILHSILDVLSSHIEHGLTPEHRLVLRRTLSHVSNDISAKLIVSFSYRETVKKILGIGKKQPRDHIVIFCKLFDQWCTISGNGEEEIQRREMTIDSMRQCVSAFFGESRGLSFSIDAEYRSDIGSLMSLRDQIRRGLPIHGTMKMIEAKNFLVVAAQQELAAVRDFLRENTIEYTSGIRKVLDGYYCDTFLMETQDGENKEIVVIAAARKGHDAMRDLIRAILTNYADSNIILVGMMGGVKDKVRLLDIVIPDQIVRFKGIGTRNGRIVEEPLPGVVSRNLLQAIKLVETNEEELHGGKIVFEKTIVTAPGKMDDFDVELTKAVLRSDNENIVGLEMESGAVAAEIDADNQRGTVPKILLVKGVADYLGSPITDEDSDLLSHNLEINGLLENGNPTTDKKLKEKLQKISTINALKTVLNFHKYYID